MKNENEWLLIKKYEEFQDSRTLDQAREVLGTGLWVTAWVRGPQAKARCFGLPLRPLRVEGGLLGIAQRAGCHEGETGSPCSAGYLLTGQPVLWPI